MARSKGKQSEFIQWLGPLLEALRELGGSAKPREAADKIVEKEKVSEKLLEETLSSGQSKFYNQVAWARQYLVWEGLLDSSKHGIWSLTSKRTIWFPRNFVHYTGDRAICVLKFIHTYIRQPPRTVQWPIVRAQFGLWVTCCL
ncbi:MAG: winged helix-turn-helix domain-containing protein [Flavobacteriales bacterium]|nr:winged helix-turn-helix domain-containing protein [Flavobacteriales bacterium]